MTDLTPADLDAIEARARVYEADSTMWPNRTVLALVALARQAERYEIALVSARATLSSARETSARYGDWSTLGHEISRIDAVLAEPAPGDGR